MVSSFRQWAANVRSFVDPSQVGFMIFYVTNRCNFRCPFCFYFAEIEKGQKPNELSIEEIRKLAPTIGPLLQLSLTGGEPFLRKDFAEVTSVLLDHTKARYITVPTNASMPERMVEYLEDVLPRYPGSYFRISFSIEGIGEAHDKLRGVPGSYEKIKESYDALSPLRDGFDNFVLDANSVMTSDSEDTLLDTVTHLSEEFEFDNLSITYARGDVQDERLKAVAAARYRAVNEFLEGLERKREKRALYPLFRGARDVSRDVLMRSTFEDEFVLPCVAGRKLVVISETGDVHPCEILDRPMGNLREFDFDLKKLLQTQENEALRNWIVDTKCKCSFECALASNVVWNAKAYPMLVKSALKNIGSETRSPDSSVENT